MHKILFFLLNFSLTFLQCQEHYQKTPIARIDIYLESEDQDVSVDKKAIISKLQTKVGDPFSQLVFDGDLKMLSNDYDRVLHDEKIVNGKIYITLRLWPKPVIRDIIWKGNSKIKSSKLQSELDIFSGSVFDRKIFNEHFNKLKEYYIKKGFFEAQLIYQIQPVPYKNQIDIEIDVKEGKSGNIQKVILKGLSPKERSAIYQQIYTKKYNFVTSWLTGDGFYEDAKIQADKMTILSYLHNQGYSDARVKIEIQDDPVTGQILVVITADRGQVYQFGTITFEGNEILTDEEVGNALFIKEGDPYSPEQLHYAIQSIKDSYGTKGYIETYVDPSTELLVDKPVYNIHLKIEEGEKFRIGMIHIIGNETTKPNVILRQSLLVPGEIFDTRMLKGTQARLENMGYFKNVNVYAVRTLDDDIFGPGYRDVYIEVEETSTGSINLSMGANSTESIFGTLELSEKNFNIAGFRTLGSKGMSGLRGGGEYFSTKATVGAKQQNYVMAWMDPYFRDSFWRLGTNLSYQTETIQSDYIRVNTYGAEMFASYPISQFLTYGSTYRLKHTEVGIQGKADKVQDPDQKDFDINTTLKNEKRNKGLISAVGMWFGYDSTDRIYKPHRGIRSELRADLAGLGGDFYFLKTNFTNTFYIPVTERSTVKLRGNLGFIFPFDHVDNVKTDEIVQDGAVDIDTEAVNDADPFGGVPFSERFYLGGVESVRGYKPLIIGPTFPNNNVPSGGISYSLVSVEYLYRVFPMMDAFVFFDGGSVTGEEFDLRTNLQGLKMSYGWGVRLELLGQAPITLGMGYPINPAPDQVEKFFFSFGTQF